MGLYKLVDDDHLVLEEPELRGNVHQLSPESDIGVFRFTRKIGKVMYFQPGDVLGYFTPSYKLNTNIYPIFANSHAKSCKLAMRVQLYLLQLLPSYQRRMMSRLAYLCLPLSSSAAALLYHQH